MALKKFKYKIGATVGKRRPYHKGHLFLDQIMLKECEEVIIVLGSSQYENTLDRPYTISEIVKMIENCHSKNLHRITIISVRDIHNINLWSQHVLRRIKTLTKKTPEVYYAGAEEDLAPFKKEKNLKTILVDREKNVFLSGTEVRQKIYNKDPEWTKHIPRCNWGIVRRIISPV